METNTTKIATKITTEITTENATKIIKSFQFKLGDHPVYVESNGQVVDEITARPYLQSHSVFVPWKPYYWFNLEFDSYIYKSIYNVCTDSFQKMAYKKVYYLKLVINTKAILKVNTVFHKLLAQNLSKFCPHILRNDIIIGRKKSFY
mgnify:FL=1